MEVATDAAVAVPARTAWLREASVAASVEASQGTRCYCMRSSPWPHSGLAGSPGLRRAWPAHHIGMPTSYSLPPRAASPAPATPFVRAARSPRMAPFVLERERMACLVCCCSPDPSNIVCAASGEGKKAHLQPLAHPCAETQIPKSGEDAYLLLPSDALNALNALLPQMPCATHMSPPASAAALGTCPHRTNPSRWTPLPA